MSYSVRISHRARVWLKSLKATMFSHLCLALLVIPATICCAQPNLPVPKIQVIAPGIWRLRFGNPEPFTPTHFRSSEMDEAGLKNMPASQSVPLDVAKVSFQVSDRGCSLQWPMKSGENLYGFGLHTRLFNMAGR